MRKLWIFAMLAPVLVAGCGQVIVFGHVVREKPASPEVKSDAPASAPRAPAASPATPSESTASAGSPSAPSPVTAAPPSTPGPQTPSVAASPTVPSPPNASTAAAPTAPSPPAPSATEQPAAPSPPVASTAAPPASLSAGSSAAPPPSGTGTRPASAPASTTHVVTAVRVSITPSAASNVMRDKNFAADALTAAIESELRARRLLNAQDPRASGTAEVTIDDLSSRPASNAVFFGYQMMVGTLSGDVRVNAAGGSDSANFKIVAASRWNFAVDGDDKNPLKPLYHRFAVLTADRLEGVPLQQDSSADRGSQ